MLSSAQVRAQFRDRYQALLSLITRSMVIPAAANQACARARNAAAVSLRSSGRISVQASREWSSRAVCRQL
ncbi:MAG TPA: hypothetical protein VHZ03_57550 [Trebonia sp.]|jgi:hypothetical protein|nr:hypothetical protein [Trebonia sp.]